jgi:hypothetical protein
MKWWNPALKVINARNTDKRLSVANEACPSANSCYSSVNIEVDILQIVQSKF